jgi:integrase
MEVMAEHLRDFTGAEANSPVFPNTDGTRLRVNNWRRRVWAPAIKAAGVAPLRVHDMRHTAVALWIATGAPVLQVSRRAGHASVSFTLDRYGHLYEEAEETLLAGLGSQVGAAQRAAGDLSGVASVTPLHRAG